MLKRTGKWWFIGTALLFLTQEGKRGEEKLDRKSQTEKKGGPPRQPSRSVYILQLGEARRFVKKPKNR